MEKKTCLSVPIFIYLQIPPFLKCIVFEQKLPSVNFCRSGYSVQALMFETDKKRNKKVLFQHLTYSSGVSHFEG